MLQEYDMDKKKIKRPCSIMVKIWQQNKCAEKSKRQRSRKKLGQGDKEEDVGNSFLPLLFRHHASGAMARVPPEMWLALWRKPDEKLPVKAAGAHYTPSQLKSPESLDGSPLPPGGISISFLHGRALVQFFLPLLFFLFQFHPSEAKWPRGSFLLQSLARFCEISNKITGKLPKIICRVASHEEEEEAAGSKHANAEERKGGRKWRLMDEDGGWKRRKKKRPGGKKKNPHGRFISGDGRVPISRISIRPIPALF